MDTCSLRDSALTTHPVCSRLLCVGTQDEDDVRYVHGQFEALDIPYDVLWLDIEHTDGKRYFTWDSFKFPKPAEMQKLLASTGRKMVTIIDPHLRAEEDYAVFAEAKQNFIRRGILSHRLLRRMWAPLGLTDSQFERLVQLLEQFEIALRGARSVGLQHQSERDRV